MIVRIRLGTGARVGKGRRKNQRLAWVAAALLSPAALVAAAFAVWRVTADMKITSNFVIASGFYSHWQSWILTASALQFCSWKLNRYARSERIETPKATAKEAAASWHPKSI